MVAADSVVEVSTEEAVAAAVNLKLTAIAVS
jgi:hypothetical protein